MGKMLSVVTAKNGLLWAHRKEFIANKFPTNTKNIKNGDELMGYISSTKTPGAVNAVWIHFGRMCELPVNWRYLSDFHMKAKRKCIKASFTEIEEEDGEDDRKGLDIYA